MPNYYYVGTLLPSFSFDVPPDISFPKLEVVLRDNLTPTDYAKTLVIRRLYDVLNLRSLWLGDALNPKADLSATALEEAIATGVGLPDYVYEYLDRYPKKEDRLRHFPYLLAKFFQSAEQIKDPFLRDYLSMERELRLVMTAFRAKKLGRDLSVELQYEDPEEDLIGQLLALQDAKTYEPPEKYKDLKILFDKHGDNPMALEKALDEYRFEKIENLQGLADVFSIEYILAYFTKYLIVEKWFELDKDKGNQIIDTIAKENHHGTSH